MLAGRIVLMSSALALIFVAGTSHAAPPRKTPVKKRATPAAKPLSPTEVLVRQLILNRYEAGEDLGNACRRASFKNLAIALNMNRDMLTREKGEFETSAEYQERTGRISGVLADKPIIFCETVDDNPDVRFTYKADEQRFEGSFSRGHNVWRDIKQLGSYRTKTRMGIPVTVKASLEFEYDVALDLPTKLDGCLSNDYAYEFQVPHPIASAPLLKAGGRIAFLAKLDAPYVSESDSPGEPTLDDPYDITTHTITIHARPERIILVDAAGKEAWSCRIGALRPLQRPMPVGDHKYWIRISDYPSSASRKNATGTVVAKLRVQADGTVGACTITSSSGFDDLDAAACSAWSERGKFVPASDAEGNPIAGEFEITKVWGRYGL